MTINRGAAMSRIVTNNVSCKNQIYPLFQNQRIGRRLKHSNIDREKGMSPAAIFRMLFTLVFTGKKLYRTLEAAGNCGIAKDTVYRGNHCNNGLNMLLNLVVEPSFRHL